jgi:hypothetical protein
MEWAFICKSQDRNTGAELPVELGTRPGPVTKIRYRWVCERPFDLLLNLGTLSGVTIYIYPAEPMIRSAPYKFPEAGKRMRARGSHSNMLDKD